MSVTFDALLQAAAPKLKKVELGELAADSVVYVKEMTAGERDSFWKENEAQKDGAAPRNIHAKLVALTLCDETGARLAPGDDGWLNVSKLSAKVVQKLFEVSTEQNKLSKESTEEVAKNSEKTQSDSSTSA